MTLDPELAALAGRIPELGLTVEERRAALDAMIRDRPVPDTSGLDVSWMEVAGEGDDPPVRVQILRPTGVSSILPTVVQVHGGGFIMGSPDLDLPWNTMLVRELGVAVAAVDYRVAPEHPYPAGPRDCLTVLRWLTEWGEEAGLDPRAMAVLADSGGGGVAASALLMARDEGISPIRLAALTQPLLDARMSTPSMLGADDTLVYTNRNARVSWDAYLQGQDPTTGYASPSLVEDLSGLPPFFISVNELDPLRDEGIDFALRLIGAGISTELHLWRGAFHGFNLLAETSIAKRARSVLVGALRSVLFRNRT